MPLTHRLNLCGEPLFPPKGVSQGEESWGKWAWLRQGCRASSGRGAAHCHSPQAAEAAGDALPKGQAAVYQRLGWGPRLQPESALQLSQHLLTVPLAVSPSFWCPTWCSWVSLCRASLCDHSPGAWGHLGCFGSVHFPARSSRPGCLRGRMGSLHLGLLLNSGCARQ